MFDVDFYTLPDGTKPVQELLDSLNIKMRSKALGSLKILQERGNTLRKPFSKPIDKGVFELRIKMTNGFVKKTQKTPRREIEKALKYKADYERRQNNG